jgi:hypothetical protein
MVTRIVNHRRTRQQTRRILAEIVVRGCDLTGSNFPEGFDLLDGQGSAHANDNRKDFAVATEGNRR